MANYRLQMVLRTDDGNPANYVTNTWHCAAITDTDAQDFLTNVITWYNTMRPYMSPDLEQNDHIFKLYDLADPEPRAPVVEGTWDLTSAPGGAAVPPEVALCMSFQGDKISGVPQARRRGRIYFGPLNSTAQSGSRPSGGIVTAMAGAGEALMDAGIATAGDWNWAVYSTVLGGTAEVTNGWVDDEFDTQRRRGRLMTTRVSWS